ncbi:hypothetical protein [Mesorhizobium sp. B1-1-8]|uniref:hypothetical protein n=1 Tax=Mesorhizobium sp. B1-1-8 TaxID=2589976 RepID=UPI0011296FBC|nr:hypothetical protein [Mesorhizobium sp. B1-1-8]UCI08756.1 hypothetical protein FJ974_06705 [Mesorhizobium sp. B1-1-8]
MHTATIEIYNHDGDIPYGVAASDAPFPSEALDTGDTNAFTSLKAGGSAYDCGLHPHEQITATR